MTILGIDYFSLVGTTGKVTHIGQDCLSYLANTHSVLRNPSFLRNPYASPGDTLELPYAASPSGSSPPILTVIPQG
ncbi:unnamed protein product [Schistosoma mattheei]|uniref:Uncharacterized protein n=1 Tax=Schistosoma mattheei TaxID=31246 RepID=A0A183NYQ9_9TREM|nr:unnamed protein product [Schistosoma mattheei]